MDIAWNLIMKQLTNSVNASLKKGDMTTQPFNYHPQLGPRYTFTSTQENTTRIMAAACAWSRDLPWECNRRLNDIARSLITVQLINSENSHGRYLCVWMFVCG